MGAGGAYEVSPLTKHMAQLAGRDFKRNNPVSDEERTCWLSVGSTCAFSNIHHRFDAENRQI